MSIRIVYVSLPTDDDSLRVRLLEPAESGDGLVPKGFHVSRLFADQSLDQVLSKHRFNTRRPPHLELLGPQTPKPNALGGEYAESVTLTLQLPDTKYTMRLENLGRYQDCEVYALIGNGCYAEYVGPDLKDSVGYHLGTIHENISRCAEADFFENFLYNALSRYDK